MYALTSGIAGWCRVTLTAQAGTLLPPAPTFGGVDWPKWFQVMPECRRPEPIGSRQRTEAEHYLLQIIDRLTTAGYFGVGWVQIAGDGTNLRNPDYELRETLQRLG